jgi:hypothetical protein
VKAGYGSLAQVKQMNVREALQALHYENFLSDYERAFIEMNKDGDGR